MNNWIVFGKTGEHTDVRIWVVCIYPNEEQALLHIDHANKWCHEKGYDLKSVNYTPDPEKNPFDPQMTVDWGGTIYYVKETKLFYQLDEFLEENGQ